MEHRILKGFNVLVTRPAHQADRICNKIETLGGKAIRLPVIEIQGPSNKVHSTKKLWLLEQFDIAIFISVNAVFWTLKLMDAEGLKFPQSLTVAAVGRATRGALEDAGINVEIIPSAHYTSEALLALTRMRAVAGQHIIILRGQGGRVKLAQTLKKRGATVDYVEVYRRCLPQISRVQIKTLLSNTPPHILTISSVEALENLRQLIGSTEYNWIYRLPLIVGSERMRQAATGLGFSHTVVAKDPGDDAVAEALSICIKR